MGKKINDVSAANHRILFFLRAVPVLLISAFSGTLLIVLNPGLFWDDWVWWFQSHAANIQIGKELGIWWAGYLSNVIYSSPNPVLLLRLIALLSWIVAGSAFTYIAGKIFCFNRREYVEVFSLIAACHIGLVRFLNSVAFYNLYIACFWIGTVLLYLFKVDRYKKYYSLPFFFLSFYLNSSLSLYLLVLIALIYFRYYEQFIDISGRDYDKNRQYPMISEIVPIFSENYSVIQRNFVSFVKEYSVFMWLPFIFYLQKKILTVSSDLYADYNAVSVKSFLNAFGKTFSVWLKVIRDYFSTLYDGVPLLWVAVGIACIFIVSLILPYSKQHFSFRKLSGRLMFSVIFGYFALFPYVAVGKPPQLRDFYESRHVLLAIPSIVMFVNFVINLLEGLFKWSDNFIRNVFRTILFSVVLGSSVASTFNVAYQYWGDWFRQIAIIEYLKKNSDRLHEFNFFIFEDNVPLKIGDRNILNYEYTGLLVSALGGRSRMGVSIEEYQGWSKSISLLKNDNMKKRFNMGDFCFAKSASHACIRTTLKDNGFSYNDFYDLIVRAIKREPIIEGNVYLLVSGYKLDIHADEQIHEMRMMKKAIYDYHKMKGCFPSSENGKIDERTLLPVYRIKSVNKNYYFGTPDVIDDIPGLFPEYMKKPLSMRINTSPESYYLYISNGHDFKLIYVSVNDIAYVKQVYPSMIDKVRETSAYGFWTKNAMSW